MEKLRIYQLREGMVLAEPVIVNDQVLLNEGTVLTSNLIRRLKEKGVFEVAVNEETTVAIDPNDVLVGRIMSHVQRFLNTYYPVEVLRLPAERLKVLRERHKKVSLMLQKIIQEEDVHRFFLDLRTTDDFTLEHSANVCVYSLIIGVTMELKDEELYHLGVGAILHDIGKRALPLEIRQKEGELTAEEREKMKEHTKEGYMILRREGIAVEAARVALHHHERWDGSGYPLGLKGEKIDLFSRIVAVADVYDALTGNRPYRKSYLPHEAVEYLYGAGNLHFDAKVVQAFLQSISPYPLGSVVQLSTGEIGVVVNVEKTFAPRPIVKICYDKDNKKLEFPRQVDLSKEKTLFITKIL